MMQEISELWKKATKVSRCVRVAKKFTGEEDFNALIELLYSPLGVEFCTEKNFPNLEGWRSFEPYGLEEKGVFVDKGDISLKNSPKLWIVGDTQAELVYDNQDHPYNVNLMHGASVRILAKNGAVVFVYGEGNFEIETEDIAKVYK